MNESNVGVSGAIKHKSISRKQAREYKARAVEFEKTNRRFIFIFPCNGDLGWYELGDMSALIYSQIVCKPKGIKVYLQDDGDSYYDQFELGRIRTLHLDTLERRIAESGLFTEKVEKGDLLYFTLKKPLSRAQCEVLRADEAARQADINRIVEVADVDAKLHQILLEVISRMRGACSRQMDGLSMASNGRRIMDLCADIQLKYYDICDAPRKTNATMLKMWREMRKMLNLLVQEVDVAVGMRIWKRHKIVSVVEKIIEAEKRVDSNIARLVIKGKRDDETSRPDKNSRRNAPDGAVKLASGGADEVVRSGETG